MPEHKGTQTIETPRLILRRAVIGDAEAMYRNWASDPEVTRFLTWPPHESVEVSRQILQSWIDEYENDSYYQWMIVLKEFGEPVGSITGMSPDDAVSSVEIGYCIGQKWWHQGIMTEALQAVLRYLFEVCGFQRILARHDSNNPHSGNVMQKCGMKFEGLFRQAGRNNQGICDEVQYALLRSEYQKPRHFMEGYFPEDESELVREIYRRTEEAKRLTESKAAQVEFLTNIRYIETYIKPGDALLDIGAGTGAYSLYFARKGCRVSALELSEDNIKEFQKKMNAQDRVDLVQGNALDLSRYEDHSFDVVLLFGPLYHLHDDRDKLQCIAEARRVCRKDGMIFFAFLSNDPVILTMQQEHSDYLLEGAYDKETFRLQDFPFVFHTVERCREILQEAGISVVHEVASDGVSELLKDRINRMDERTYQQYLRYHFYLCEKKECIGMSNHLLFAGR